MGRIKFRTLIKKYIKGLQPINVNVNNIVLAPNELLMHKNVIITGAGSGIGEAIAKAMIASGANVVAIGRDIKKLDSARKKISLDKYIPYVCDISDVNNITQHIANICKLFNDEKIDVLVNCAGIKNGNDERFFEFSSDDFDNVINTNLKGTFFWCQQIAKFMISKQIKGHIVNIISIKGFIGESSPYSVSKWGCVGLTKGLARILAPQGIVVNGIAPGGTKTDMAHLKNDSMLHLATSNMRLADPNEIANIAVFLASDLGDNIIGDIVISDGGQVLQYGNNRC